MIEVVAVRQSWAQADEPICWLIDAKGPYLFEVAGRDASGQPKKGFAARVAGGVGGAVLEVAEAVSASSEPSYRDLPAGVVSGERADCAAASLVDAYRERGGRAGWVLTDRRIGLVGVADPEETPQESGSLFARARRMGAGLLPGGETSAVADGGAVAPVVRGWAEWPRSTAAVFEASRRKLGQQYRGGTTHFVRMELNDGSALELGGSAVEADALRLAAMSYGRA